MGCGRDGVCPGGHGLIGLVRGRIDWMGRFIGWVADGEVFAPAGIIREPDPVINGVLHSYWDPM